LLNTVCRLDTHLPLCEPFKERFQAANIIHWNEVVVKEIVFYDKPVIDNGILGMIIQNDLGKLTMGIVTVKTQESNRVIKSKSKPGKKATAIDHTMGFVFSGFNIVRRINE
jgi:hypothetical protein